ncbi:Uroporphyrinogen-III decarboxylase [Caldanaerobius fijiensis DSM 17918]|uniref:Uroporphyrinogen-III decarboxylase n=1 Tax=Caldanaerobius fijiensis DSM 17918 TaxID=1121256 RepID=A0A1M4ZZV8_9THEO|nr:uroporphyrinogen decarboxylase family protein [Caldanaerobius fijiensis]SHF23511.1 Uroporphyrinogen-III decarboxylase [Caldanaerobius fijiensis DSM 17918]
MNQRERFLNTMRFKSVDRVPFYIGGPWATTLKRWHSEGLPENVDLNRLFDADGVVELGIYFGMCPAFERTVLEEDDAFVVYINHEGIKMREKKTDPETSMPDFLEFPVKNREDYHKLKWRFRLNAQQRITEEWKKRARFYNENSNLPIRMFADREGGFFGPLRNLMGLENLVLTFYDDPVLIEEMMDDKAELIIAIVDEILKYTKIDFFAFWEDMAYNHGSLISPQMVRKFMLPRYRKVTDFLRSKGIDLIFVDSDGDISELIPIWLEAGINGVWPLEVQSGMDVVKLRQEYPELRMIGGIDKKVLAKDERAIREEILRKVPPLIEKGGYIPDVDHSIPPDVPLKNYLYYLKCLRSVIEKGSC